MSSGFDSNCSDGDRQTDNHVWHATYVHKGREGGGRERGRENEREREREGGREREREGGRKRERERNASLPEQLHR